MQSSSSIQMMAPEFLPSTTLHPTMRRDQDIKVATFFPANLWLDNAPILIVTIASAHASPYTDLKSQKAFEKGLLEKTAKQTSDIILYDNRVVLYKSESDVMMYVVGGVDENEIMLYNVILAMRDSMHLLFKYVPLPLPK